MVVKFTEYKKELLSSKYSVLSSVKKIRTLSVEQNGYIILDENISLAEY